MSKIGGKKLKKRWIILAIVIVLVVAIVIGIMNLGKNFSMPIYSSDVVTLSKGDFVKVINETGVIGSDNSEAVFCLQNYAVDELNVEVGDTVKKGDVLAQLEKDALERQIALKEEEISKSDNSSSLQITQATDKYNDAKESVDDLTHSAILNAQKMLDSAQRNADLAKESYEDKINEEVNYDFEKLDISIENALVMLNSAKETYEDMKDDVGFRYTDEDLDEATEDYNKAYKKYSELTANAGQYTISDLTAAKAKFDAAFAKYNNLDPSTPDAEKLAAKGEYEAAFSEYNAIKSVFDKLSSTEVNAAKKAFEDATKELDKIKSHHKVTDKDLENAKDALDNAQRGYDTAVLTKESAIDATDKSEDQLKKAWENAEFSLEQAKKDYDNALDNAQKEVDAYKDSLDTILENSSLKMSYMTLENLKEDLEDTTITAPIDGTVTAVYATEGCVFTGLMFVVEDLDVLKVKSELDEYDVLEIAVGTEVSVNAVGNDDDTYKGVVREIAPTAKKDQTGNTITGMPPYYEVEIEIIDNETPFLVGMNVEVDYKIETTKESLTVPLEAIYINENEERCVLTLVEDGAAYKLVEEVIKIGNGDNFKQIISGENINEGTVVVKDYDTYKMFVGMPLTFIEGENPLANADDGMFGGMPTPFMKKTASPVFVK